MCYSDPVFPFPMPRYGRAPWEWDCHRGPYGGGPWGNPFNMGMWDCYPMYPPNRGIPFFGGGSGFNFDLGFSPWGSHFNMGMWDSY